MDRFLADERNHAGIISETPTNSLFSARVRHLLAALAGDVVAQAQPYRANSTCSLLLLGGLRIMAVLAER